MIKIDEDYLFQLCIGELINEYITALSADGQHLSHDERFDIGYRLTDFLWFLRESEILGER